MDNRFARIGETAAQYKERRDSETKLVFERKVVKRLLLGLGVDRVSLGVERPDSKDEDGSFMTFAWLYDRYPTFPVILTTRETWMPSVIDFFRVRSRKNSFWMVWEEIVECLKRNNKPIGCVFPFPQVSDLGIGIVHTVLLPYDGFNRDMETVYMLRRTEGAPIILEQLDSFTNRLRMDWEAT